MKELRQLLESLRELEAHGPRIEYWYDRLAKRRESVWTGEYGENRRRVLRQLIEHLEHRLEDGDA